MPKATFLQTLLNRPTKKYTFPAPKKDYALQRGEFVRAAHLAHADAELHASGAAAEKGSQGSSAGSTLVQEQVSLPARLLSTLGRR